MWYYCRICFLWEIEKIMSTYGKWERNLQKGHAGDNFLFYPQGKALKKELYTELCTLSTAWFSKICGENPSYPPFRQPSPKGCVPPFVGSVEKCPSVVDSILSTKRKLWTNPFFNFGQKSEKIFSKKRGFLEMTSNMYVIEREMSF